jgi:hypothetical protein
MRSRSKRSLITIGTTLLGIIALALSFAGTNPGSRLPSGEKKPVSSSTSRRTPTEHTLYSGLWHTDLGFVSTAHIKNVLVTAPLVVTPIVYMADGTEYDLPALTLGPGGISDLNINEALRGAPSSVQNHLSESGTLVLRFTSQSVVNAAANMQILNEPQSLIFTISSRPMGHALMASGPQDLESIWWKHDPGVTASVALFNASDAPRQVTLNVSGSTGTLRSQPLTLGGKNTIVLDLEPAIRQLPDSEQLEGGVRITYEGLPGDIFATTTLANTQEGYSATSEFHPFHAMMAKAAPADVSYGSVGLMVGLQDPMMGFPKDALFSVYAALRNAGDHPLTVKPVLFLMESGEPRIVKLPPEHFSPGEARQLSFAKTLSNFNGMATLTFIYEGHPGDLLIATGSVDQTGTYVFEVMPDGLGTTWAKNAPFWRVTGGFDSMLSVFNPQDAPEDIVLKLTYARGTGHYAVPLHLAAGETQMLDVKDIIDMQQPDSEGNVIPRDVTEGSAQFAGPNGIAQEIRIGVSAGIFNVQTATCGGGCLICTSTIDNYITPNPMAIQAGSSQQASALVVLSDGSQEDKTLSASWGSDTSIATVQAGLVDGIAPGSATISASFQAPSTDPPPEGCQNSCPMEPFIPLASANVLPVITSVSPSRGLIGATTSSVTITGKGFSGGHVNTPAAIQVSNITTATDTQITFDAVISGTATPGNNAGAISVTTSSQTSNAKDFYVQVPTSLSMVAGTAGGTSETACTLSACGTLVHFVYQVNDQDSSPKPINASMSMWDSFGSFNPDGLSLNGPPQNTTCTPVNTGPCGVFTGTDGKFTEGQLGGCSTVCVVNGACAAGGPSDITQTWHIAGYPIAQQISMYCQKVLVNGVQVQ